ncbi:MAG: pyridoxamine 5'-phosphate oxidase family protein [Candidatus Thorarchaeota archaeon]|nr:pyridoxamine 5'-phosphate oxidase family protein [Candidatus Thorarchaeota archaeon]
MKYTEGSHEWPMQREHRRIENTEDIKEILKLSKIGHLGLTMDGKPYVVPVNFVFRGGDILITCFLQLNE